jgi:adenine-specific DNA-methyltransferase
VIWKRRNDPRNTAQHVSTDHDSILVFARDIETLRTNHLPRTEAMDKAYTNPDDDERGPWRRSDLAARNYYSKGLYPVITPSGRVIDGPPSGSYWRVSKEELERLDQDGRIYWGADGSSRPYLKRFLSEVKGGRVPSSVWPPEEVGFVRNGKEEVRALVGDVFATPKPERLMQRVIQIATDPGDLVLDCFLGSGTTAAVAHKMGRRWVGIERSPETIEHFALPRLKKVVAGQDAGGVTQENEWEGGGGFRLMDVLPSMFEDVGGVVALAEWATNGALAETTAAQVGFAYIEQPPFSGVRGHQRLAVLDGMLNQSVLDMLIRLLAEDETLFACATAVEAAAAEYLRVERPGSEVRKIPSSLLAAYKKASRPTAEGASVGVS